MSYESKVTNRLKRVEGQLRGIVRMMDEEQDCKQIITQLSAVRSAIDRTIGVIVTENLVNCLDEAKHQDGAAVNELVEEAMKLVIKSR